VATHYGNPSAPADVTITVTTQALTGLVFGRPDAGAGITGETRAVQRFRELIRTLADVVQPSQTGAAGSATLRRTLS
jgi:ethanolamine ammonia-lyase large subunit